MENHTIWTYQNLKLPLESYSKQDQKLILQYIKEANQRKVEKKEYEEAMYCRPVKNVIQYDREPPKYIAVKALEEPKEENIKNQILNINYVNE